MDVVQVCVAAYLHVSMCCMRTRAWTDYLPRKACYAEMLYAERNVKSNRRSSWLFDMGAMVMAEAVVVIGPTTTVSLANARTSM